MPSLAPIPLVAILLCTRNGERYLERQLDSIETQMHTNWRVWVSDDNSSDATLALLARRQQVWGGDRLTILAGPGRGATANFMSLVRRDEILADYFAFADQDDVWWPIKLSRALDWLQSQPDGLPLLYCGRTEYIDESGRPLGFSPPWSRPPAFANALVQNIAGGNTMVFNRVARRLIGAVNSGAPLVVHDWWAYLVVAGSGGRVYFDPEPSVSYRQHPDNLIGSNAGLVARATSVWRNLRGQRRAWYERNLYGLLEVESALTDESRTTLAWFVKARVGSLSARLRCLRKSGAYMQTRSQTGFLYLLALLNKV